VQSFRAPSDGDHSAFTAFRPTIFGQRDPVLHAKRKRIVSHGYSMNALQAMEKYVQDRLKVFIDKMSGFAASGHVVDLSKWAHFFAFDVIGELVCLNPIAVKPW
jgi:cytochrome P450